MILNWGRNKEDNRPVRKRRKQMLKKLIIGTILMSTCLTAGCTTVEVPEIKGRVVNAETGKPLANANVMASWKVGIATFAGLAGIHSVEKYITHTDENGEFVLPRIKVKKKAISGSFEGVSILVYTSGYKSAHIVSLFAGSRGFRKDKRKPYFELMPLKTREDYYDALYYTPWHVVDAIDREFQISFNYDYITKFPDDKEADVLFRSIAQHYRDLGDYKKAVEVFEEVINKYPGTYTAKRAEEELIELKAEGKK